MARRCRARIHPADVRAVLDIALVATCIYGLFSLIRGTRAVRLVIGVSCSGVYAMASWIRPAAVHVGSSRRRRSWAGRTRRHLPAGAATRAGAHRPGRIDGLAALAGRRAADRRTSRSWPAAAHSAREARRAHRHRARDRARGDGGDRRDAPCGPHRRAPRHDLHASLAAHDGAVIVRDDRIVAAGDLLPLTETSLQSERFGTRHRAALGITEATDALVVVVSEEKGQMSLVERARIVRDRDRGATGACDARPAPARPGRPPPTACPVGGREAGERERRWGAGRADARPAAGWRTERPRPGEGGARSG